MIFVLAFLALCSTLFAQSSLSSEADSLFHAGDYERVELLTLRAANNPELPDTQRISLELLGGYSLIMLNRETDARVHFQRALEIDSTLSLDPVQVSPKFRVVFDDVKSEWLTRRIQNIPSSRVREVAGWRHASSESHLLNLILPGAGFLNERQSVRGVVHIIAQTAITALWLSELSQNNSARKEYLAADSSQVQPLYKTYDDHHRRMWTYGLAAAGIYLASQVDLTIWRTRQASFEILPAESVLRFNIGF